MRLELMIMQLFACLCSRFRRQFAAWIVGHHVVAWVNPGHRRFLLAISITALSRLLDWRSGTQHVIAAKVLLASRACSVGGAVCGACAYPRPSVGEGREGYLLNIRSDGAPLKLLMRRLEEGTILGAYTSPVLCYPANRCCPAPQLERGKQSGEDTLAHDSPKKFRGERARTPRQGHADRARTTTPLLSFSRPPLRTPNSLVLSSSSPLSPRAVRRRQLPSPARSPPQPPTAAFIGFRLREVPDPRRAAPLAPSLTFHRDLTIASRARRPASAPSFVGPAHSHSTASPHA